VAGYTLVTFAAGGMADWFPTWLARYRAMDLEEAGTVVGAVTVVGGLFGTACGGWLADRLVGRTKNPYLALAAGSMLPASALAALALAAPNGAPVIACLLAAQFFLWFYNGPINALIVNAVGTELRPRAFALSILCIHLFGDAISPPIIGAISDRTGELTHGVLLVPVFLALGAAVWAVGWRRLSAAVEAG
jgi:sugar phosphate permease